MSPSLSDVKFRFAWPAKGGGTYHNAVWLEEGGWTCDGRRHSATAELAARDYQWHHCGQWREIEWLDPPTPSVEVKVK